MEVASCRCGVVGGQVCFVAWLRRVANSFGIVAVDAAVVVMTVLVVPVVRQVVRPGALS